MEQSSKIKCTTTTEEYINQVCNSKKSRLYETEGKSQKNDVWKDSSSWVPSTNIRGWLGKVSQSPNKASALLHSLNAVCIKQNFCMEKTRHAPLKKKLSTNTLHSIESLVDLRSWCSCEIERRQYYMEELLGRSGKGVAFGGGDSCAANESSTGEVTIKEMDDSLLQLQHLLNEKDKEIQNLHKRLSEAEQRRDCFENRVDNSKTSNKCEQESIVLETDLNPGQQGTTQRGVLQGRGPGSSGDSSMYEISYSHDYEVDGDLLKYLGTKLLYQGPKNENIGDQGERRVLETDRQIEIATLNTHILQLKRALDDEKKKSDDLLKRLKVCEEDKAALRARSPMSRAPVQNIVSSVSVHQMQQRELARQVEDGRKMLKEKEKEIRSLKNKITDYEAKLSDKDNHEQELAIRLNNTIAMLKRCEEHGRELTASNKEQVHEIRRLRTQLDRANVNRNSENCPPTGSGSEYFENYMRAKSHRKALAWQKKYLSSVILGYKSILRQNGHGSEHPDLLQTQIPIAPGAVGYLDTQSPRTRFRIGVLSVIATLRMKYMVSRWNKKRPGETSPDSEYKMSRHSTRVDTNIIRPRRTTLMHSSRVNSAHTPSPIDNNVNTQETRRGNLGDISEYLSRFATLENEISSSLSRNVRPNRPK